MITRDKVREDFIERSKGLPVQPPHGRQGQMAAINGHGLNSAQIQVLKSAPFPILSIVGDLVCYAL